MEDNSKIYLKHAIIVDLVKFIKIIMIIIREQEKLELARIYWINLI